MLIRIGLLTALVAVSFIAPAEAAARDQREDRNARHALLISVDGLHASDLSKWIAEHPGSTFARLSKVGTTYSHASASEPSDSFPGLLAMVTGGSPKTTGVFYDDSYDRRMWAPGSNCAGLPGTETVYDESIDKTVNGVIPLFISIDPAQLPMGKVTGQCVGVFPHSFLKTNTIFEVIRVAGMYTAWSDKHPAYDIVNGPSGKGVIDLFTPEINNADDPTGTSVAATDAYDQIKVNAVLNEIDGKTSDGQHTAPVPAIFGMNFQSVSVGQKLVDPVLSGRLARRDYDEVVLDPESQFFFFSGALRDGGYVDTGPLFGPDDQIWLWRTGVTPKAELYLPAERVPSEARR